MNELQLAKQVSMALESDKMKEIFLGATDEFRVELVLAYAASEVKKFEQFVMEYLTKQEVREKFQSLVLNIAA